MVAHLADGRQAEVRPEVCQAVMEARQAEEVMEDGRVDRDRVDGKHRNTASIYNVQTINAISDFKILPQTSRVVSLI